MSFKTAKNHSSVHLGQWACSCLKQPLGGSLTQRTTCYCHLIDTLEVCSWELDYVPSSDSGEEQHFPRRACCVMFADASCRTAAARRMMDDGYFFPPLHGVTKKKQKHSDSYVRGPLRPMKSLFEQKATLQRRPLWTSMAGKQQLPQKKTTTSRD